MVHELKTSFVQLVSESEWMVVKDQASYSYVDITIRSVFMPIYILIQLPFPVKYIAISYRFMQKRRPALSLKRLDILNG